MGNKRLRYNIAASESPLISVTVPTSVPLTGSVAQTPLSLLSAGADSSGVMACSLLLKGTSKSESLLIAVSSWVLSALKIIMIIPIYSK